MAKNKINLLLMLLSFLFVFSACGNNINDDTKVEDLLENYVKLSRPLSGDYINYKKKRIK
jgi:hypothetical protein